MRAGIEDYYEVNQEATGGPVLPWSGGLTWRDHIRVILLLLALFVITAGVSYYNLTLLYYFNPDYGRDLAMERAFCAEIDKEIISSVYYFDEVEKICRAVRVEVKR